MNKGIIVDQIQVALFPSDQIITSNLDLALKLKELDSIKNIEQDSFAENFPGDLVRIKAFTDKNNIELQISTGKVGFYFYKVNEINFSNGNEITFIKDVMSNILEVEKYNRVGLITTVYKIYDDPDEIINSRMLKVNIPNRLKAIQLKMTYDISLESNLTSENNLVVEIATGSLKLDPTKKLVKILYDVNTHQNISLDWSFTNVQHFLNEAINKSKPEYIYNTFLEQK